MRNDEFGLIRAYQAIIGLRWTMSNPFSGWTDDGRLWTAHNGKIWYLKPVDATNRRYTIDYVDVLGVGRNDTINPEKDDLPAHVQEALEQHGKEYARTADSLESAMQ